MNKNPVVLFLNFLRCSSRVENFRESMQERRLVKFPSDMIGANSDGQQQQHNNASARDTVFRFHPMNHSRMVAIIVRYAGANLESLVRISHINSTYYTWSRRDPELARAVASIQPVAAQRLLFRVVQRKLLNDGLDSADEHMRKNIIILDHLWPHRTQQSDNEMRNQMQRLSVIENEDVRTCANLDQLIIFLRFVARVESSAASALLAQAKSEQMRWRRDMQRNFFGWMNFIFVLALFVLCVTALAIADNGGVNECCDATPFVNVSCPADLLTEIPASVMGVNNRTCAFSNVTGTSCTQSKTRTLTVAACACAVVAAFFQFLLHCARFFFCTARGIRDKGAAAMWTLLSWPLWVSVFAITAVVVSKTSADTVYRSFVCAERTETIGGTNLYAGRREVYQVTLVYITDLMRNLLIALEVVSGVLMVVNLGFIVYRSCLGGWRGGSDSDED